MHPPSFNKLKEIQMFHLVSNWFSSFHITTVLRRANHQSSAGACHLLVLLPTYSTIYEEVLIQDCRIHYNYGLTGIYITIQNGSRFDERFVTFIYLDIA